MKVKEKMRTINEMKSAASRACRLFAGALGGVVGPRARTAFVFGACACALVFPVAAQVSVNTNFPDPSIIANNVQAPFNNTLTFVIGATAVLAVVAWILKALFMRKR